MNDDYDYYSTSDLSLASTISLYFPIETINKSSHKAQFVFKKSDELKKIVESYWKGELKVDPQAFFNQLRSIKARLYEEE